MPPRHLLHAVAARSTDPQFLGGLGHLPNPDIVLRKLGRREEVFAELLADAHVQCVTGARKSAVLGRQVLVRAASSARGDQRAAERVRDHFKRLRLRDAMETLCDAPLWGRAYLEVMWAREGGELVIAELKDRPQRRFVYGEVDGELRVLTRARALNGEPVPPFKLLQARSGATDDNPYGRAALSACYWPWLFKHHGWKWWAVFAERYGMPWLVGRLPKGASRAEEQAMDAALARAVQDASIRLPADASVELLQAQGATSSGVYHDFTGAANNDISKAILGQTLTTEVGDVGSYAAASVHNQVRQDLAESDAEIVQRALQELADWITRFNAAGEAPTVELIEDRVPGEWLEAIGKARDAGIPVPVSWALERTGIPDAGGEPVLGPVGAAEFAADAPEHPEDAGALADTEAVLDALAGHLGSSADRVGRRWGAAIVEALGRPKVEAVLRSEGAAAAVAMLPGLGSLRGGDELAGTLADAAVTAHLAGWVQARDEAREQSADFADEDPIRGESLFTPLPFREAARFALERQVMSPAEFEALSDAARTQAFTVAGVQSQRTLEAIRDDLAQAITRGTTLREFRAQIAARVTADGLPKMNRRHIETIWRTNLATAHNAGRYRQQASPDSIARRPYWMYDAVNDSRTRPAHRAMDGRVFGADDPIWGEWYPPNGHRCRCRVVALSASDIEARGLTVVRDGRAFVDTVQVVEGEVTKPAAPDPGFAVNPGREWVARDSGGGPTPSAPAAPASPPAPARASGASSALEAVLGAAMVPPASPQLDVDEIRRRLEGLAPSTEVPLSEQLAARGISIEQMQAAAQEASWATEEQAASDAGKLGLEDYQLSMLEQMLLEEPDAVVGWWYAPASRVQFAFYQRRPMFFAGSWTELRDVAVIWDPVSGIEGLHDGYDDLTRANSHRRAIEVLRRKGTSKRK